MIYLRPGLLVLNPLRRVDKGIELLVCLLLIQRGRVSLLDPQGREIFVSLARRASDGEVLQRPTVR